VPNQTAEKQKKRAKIQHTKASVNP